MKSNSTHDACRPNRHRNGFIVVALGLALIAAAQAQARLNEATGQQIRYGRTASGYVYMNGGVSARDHAELEGRSAAYNVKLILVPPKAFPLSQMVFFIANNLNGKIEKVALSAPVLYFRLPAGSYTFGARIRNRIFLLRDIRVQDAGRQTYVLRAAAP